MCKKITKCKQCGEYFTKIYNNHQYCSECGSRIATQRRGAKKRGQDVKEKVMVTSCAHCQEEIRTPPGKNGPVPVYCSQRCRTAAYNKRKADRLKKAGKWYKIVECKCVGCGDLFKYKRIGRERIVCNRCKNGFTAPCDVCGKAYKRRYHNNTGLTKYCSRSCASRAIQLSRPIIEKTCMDCGQPFEVRDYIGPVGITDRCQKCRNKREMSRQRQRKLLYYYGVDGEDLDYLRVYKRDKYTCQLCWKPVNINLDWPHKMSASIDHIKPLSKGGKHTYKNIQLAHLTCNMSKGADYAQ